MVHSKFLPSIEYDGDLMTVTLPADERTRFWNTFGDEARKIVALDGINRTQVSIKPNPGFSRRTAQVIALTALNFAATGTLLDFNSHVGVAYHTASINLMPRMKDEARYTEDEVLFALRLIIPHLAAAEVARAAGEIDSLSLIPDWSLIYDEMVEAYRRLEYLDTRSTFLTRDEWARRLGECKLDLDIIKYAKHQVIATNQKLAELKNQVRNLSADFTALSVEAANGEFDLDELHRQKKQTLVKLAEIRVAYNLCYTKVEDNDAQQAVQEIKLLTPPPSAG